MNHQQEALRVISTLPGGDTLDQAYAYAQVHATLALVEQQRIANQIALDAHAGIGKIFLPDICFVCDSDPCDREGHEPHYGPSEISPEILEALGLGDPE